MINFHYLTDFQISDETEYTDWIDRIITSENGVQGELDFIFCDDEYLLKINQDFLQHDTFTDIITFPYGDDQNIAGDIFISVDRVRENAKIFKVEFETEMRRVISHGILHMLGFGDKTDQESELMREKENEKLKMFHVEH
ncbi:rRNA maturation RNase YbeY [Arenibacter latericius]|uniref:rRNA maturation RNase YbeY n=1 Tax=Arenibacter latericius TaxID=86104 RepID=UPI00041AFAEB|nr:rRNA maturation RNase YbeY [Arenibacter latericius]MDX1364481.1 rRNA maturation RNase YbeY [Arenibacter latericius]